MEELVFQMSQLESFDASYQAWIVSRAEFTESRNNIWHIACVVSILSFILFQIVTHYHHLFLGDFFGSVGIISCIIMVGSFVASFNQSFPKSKHEYIRAVEHSLIPYKIIVK